MSVRKIKNHAKWVWQARVAYKGLRKAAFRATKEEARDAEAELLRELKARVAEAESAGQRPATVRSASEELERLEHQVGRPVCVGGGSAGRRD